MGCQNSTAKNADDKKKAAAQNSKPAAAKPAEKKPAEKKPAEKPKNAVPADDATHITAHPTPAATSPAAPAPLEAEPVKEDEAKKNAEAAAAADEKATEAKVAEEKAGDDSEEVATAAEEVVAVDPAEEPAVPAAVVAEVPAVANPPASAEGAPAPLEATAAPAAQVATAPAEDDDASPYERRRRSTATPIHQESQAQRAADPNSPYAGPGPAETFPIDIIYRCFEEENGLLFRLVNKKRHMWAFYNDTTEYVMKVSVTFGPESSVTALDDTTATAENKETGECTLVLAVPPGATKRFMRGEYNGFTTSYDAEPIEEFEETLEAPHDVPVTAPIEFTANAPEASNDGNASVALENNSDGGTRIHFMEVDPSKEEPEDDLKKRREEA